MHGSIYGIALLGLVLSSSINPGCCQSPCPNYFRYLKDDITGEVIGRIEIPRAPKNVALHLRISLSVATALPTKYVGRLGLATSRSDAVKAVRQGRPLIYRLHFPVRNPIPLLTGITFNGQRYCTGQPATGPVVTTLFLEHTLYPPGVLPLGSDSQIQPLPDMDLSPSDTDSDSLSPILLPDDDDSTFPEIQIPTQKPPPEVRPSGTTPDTDNTFSEIQPPKTRPQPEIFTSGPTSDIDYPFLRPGAYHNRNEKCGISITGGVNNLIAHGQRTSPGQWPWLVAIFLTKIEYEFQCAGSLVTHKHVITAAHCKFDNDVAVPASAFLVSVGLYHLEDRREKGSKNVEVLEYRSHPDYRSRSSADADLAVMVLRERVEYTPRIQPLCLWTGPIGLEHVVGRNGYVVGWGRDEHGNQHLKEPRMAQMPIVSQENCLRSSLAFVPATSNRTFCAGLRNGSGPCNGDSGSGLVMLDAATGRYHLRGIVSLSLADKVTMSCDLTAYIVYADAAKYLDWIRAETRY